MEEERVFRRVVGDHREATAVQITTEQSLATPPTLQRWRDVRALTLRGSSYWHYRVCRHSVYSSDCTVQHHRCFLPPSAF